MSVYSMTGFGKGEASGGSFTIITEIKTVNNRFKDFKFRMSSLFNYLELDLRSKLEDDFRRGSFDISVTYKKNEKTQTEFQVDPKKVEAFLTLMRPTFENAKLNFHVSPTDFLRSDFYKDEDGQKENELGPLVLQSFDQAIKALNISRSHEGQKLVEKLLEHFAIYEACLEKVEQLKTQYPDMMKDKLTSKLNEKLKKRSAAD